MGSSKILVAEDDFMSRELLVDIISESEIEVITAEDGAEAFDKFSKDSDNINLIISDMHMPNLNGLSLIKKLRENEFDVPIIILTGSSEITLAIEAMHNGASDYLSKDDNIEETLMVSINSTLEKKAIQDQNRQLLIDLQGMNEQLQIKNKFIKETFGRYMSDDVVAQLLESPEGLQMGGKKQKVSIVMTDIRGFSALCERHSAEAVVTVLNSYLEMMTNIIFKHGGTILEIIGDAIMIIFGAPTVSKNDSEHAVASAIEMLLEMDAVNEKNKLFGMPDLEMGIGINTGDVVAGNIGSQKRVKYDVIGSNVNLAARIESYSVGGQLLISESTLKEVSDLAVISNQFSISFKGIGQPVPIYDVVGMKGDYDVHLPEVSLDLVLLENKMELKYSVLDSKITTDPHLDGKIVALSTKLAVLYSETSLDVLSNIIMKLSGIDCTDVESLVYGKVMQIYENRESTYLVRFTSISEKALEHIESLIEEK